MKTAGEGGAWGMAILAAYAAVGNRKALPEFLEKEVFSSMEVYTVSPDANGAAGFAAFLENYKKGLAAEYAAAK